MTANRDHTDRLLLAGQRQSHFDPFRSHAVLWLLQTEFAGGRIQSAEVIADPARLRALDLAVLR